MPNPIGRPPVPDNLKRSLRGRINATFHPEVRAAVLAAAGDNISRWLEAAAVEKLRRDRKRKVRA
jgi:hypothetical protein